MKIWTHAIASAALAICTLQAIAQDAGATKIIVGFPAGDVSDILARMTADAIRSTNKQTIIIDNRPGAGGMIAAEATKAAAPDGKTLMLSAFATMVTFPYSFERLRYDPIKDFEPVAVLTTFDLALAVNAATGPKTLAEFSQRAKTDQTMASFASPAAGSLPHFFGLLLGQSINVKMLHVPYRGDAPAKQGLLGGEVGSMVGPVASFLELEKAGKLRILATSGARRSPMLPNVPTFKEAGIDMEATPWFALFAPHGTPKETVARWSKMALDAVNTPELKTRLAEYGLQASDVGPQGLAETMRRDHQRWSAIIKESGFKAN